MSHRPKGGMAEAELIRSGYYDFCSNKIKCVADALGFAHIYDFRHSSGELVSVLALDSVEAEQIYRDVKGGIGL